MTPKPKGPKGRANWLHIGFTVVAAAAKNPGGGWAWVKFLTSAEGFELRPGVESGVPARKSAANSPRLQGSIWSPERGTPAAWRDSVATMHEAPQVLNYFVVQGEIDKALGPIWRGEKTAKQAMDELVPAIDALLARG